MLDWSKLKAFAEKKINMIYILKFVYERIEDSVENGEIAGVIAFSPFPTIFSRSFTIRVVESLDYVIKG